MLQLQKTLFLSAALAFGLAFAAPMSGFTQEATGPTQVISANPFGLIFNFFNGEYERAILRNATLGVGGSTIEISSSRYINADVFWRYYPQARPLQGFALGLKAGLTGVDDEQFFGLGFDTNYSWLLGDRDNFYVGIGFGLKRLLGTPQDEFGDDSPAIIPTFRIVNLGWAF